MTCFLPQVKTFKADTVCQVNPAKFDCSEDMADLTFLGDACVLWNSVVRYKNELIYTYSGLFCIAINPYKRYPIYTLRTNDTINNFDSNYSQYCIVDSNYNHSTYDLNFNYNKHPIH